MPNQPFDLTPREMNYREAIKIALLQEMRRDENVLLLGEDIGAFGGVYAVTRGLLDEFGAGRVIDTPISEAGFMGLAMGAAVAGKRPVAEIMYMDFLGVCADILINQAPKMRGMSGGQLTVPLVVRTQTGGWRASGAQHSQSLEMMVANVPGIKIVIPSTPADVHGLLRQAIRDDNPVLIMEHRLLYGTKGFVDPAADPIPFGQALVRRSGGDVTLIATSMSVHNALAAANELEEEGIDAEVIDLRTIVPLDQETILDSVRKTRRAVVVHQAHRTFGPGGEIASLIHENAFESLLAPVARVGSLDIVVPANTALEGDVLPSKPAIVAAAIDVMQPRPAHV